MWYLFSGFPASHAVVYASIKDVLRTLGGWQCVSAISSYAQENSPSLKGFNKYRLRSRLDELVYSKEIQFRRNGNMGFYHLPQGRFVSASSLSSS